MIQEKVLAKLRKIVLALPGTLETSLHGHPIFRTRQRIFCALHEDRSGVQCIWLRLEPLAIEILRDDPRVIRASHGGANWIDLRADGRIAWRFVRELAEDAHHLALPEPKRAMRRSSA